MERRLARLGYAVLHRIDGLWHLWVCNLVEKLYERAGLLDPDDDNEESHLPSG
jgi:hypothetical protein